MTAAEELVVVRAELARMIGEDEHLAPMLFDEGAEGAIASAIVDGGRESAAPPLAVDAEEALDVEEQAAAPMTHEERRELLRLIRDDPELGPALLRLDEDGDAVARAITAELGALSLEEVSILCSCSRERVRQIESAAIRAIQRQIRRQGREGLVDDWREDPVPDGEVSGATARYSHAR